MKNVVIISLFSVLWIAAPVDAHEGHDHSYITETAAIAVGKSYAVQLIGQKGEFEVGQLSETWRQVPVKDAHLLKNGDGYYIVSVLNQVEQKTLFVLMTSNGDVYGANFTGEFAILN